MAYKDLSLLSKLRQDMEFQPLQTDLVLAGTHRGACVLLTARSAVKNGFKIHTSDQLLFGYTEDYDPERRAQQVLEEYKALGVVYESVEDIVKRLFTTVNLKH